MLKYLFLENVSLYFISSFQTLFSDFMQDVLDKDGTLGDSLVKQILLCAQLSPPTPQTRGLHLPAHAANTWLPHHLAELREVLATLLVYYGSTAPSLTPDTFRKLVQLAQVNCIKLKPRNNISNLNVKTCIEKSFGVSYKQTSILE